MKNKRNILILSLLVIFACCGFLMFANSGNDAPQTVAAPTPTTSQNTEAETAYIDEMVKQYEHIANASGALGERFAEPKPDDSTWMTLVESSLVLIDESADNIAALTPPETMTDLHEANIAAGEACKAANTILRDILATQSLDRMTEYQDQSGECATLIEQANVLSQEFR